MSTLGAFEKRKIEKLFGMGSGYVLDFSDRTFREFVLDVVGKNIYDDVYRINSSRRVLELRPLISKSFAQYAKLFLVAQQ